MDWKKRNWSGWTTEVPKKQRSGVAARLPELWRDDHVPSGEMHCSNRVLTGMKQGQEISLTRRLVSIRLNVMDKVHPKTNR
jgi:hypothetical protein